MPENKVYLAAVEGGGTTFVVAIACVDDGGENNNNILNIGSRKLQLLHTASIPKRDEVTGEIPNNRTPEQIINETCSFFREKLPPDGRGHYSALGIATFGPAGVDPKSKLQYGKILAGSPKKQWRGVDILSPIKEACGLVGKLEERVAFDTDVNAPAMAEFRHRCYLQQHSRNTSAPSPKPLTSLSYVTVGTGVGVGMVINSQPLHGLLHPEGGHTCIQPLPDDKFTGYSWGAKSPYKGLGTVEGVASSVALTERWIQMEQEAEMVKKLYGKSGVSGNSSSPFRNRDENQQQHSDVVSINTNDRNGDNAQTREILSTLPDTHPIWLHASNAIANLCVSLLLLTSCQKIVLGGGIMKRDILYSMVRSRVWTLLNGYLDSVDELSDERKLEDVIVGSSWEEVGSGLVGAFALALDAYEKDGIEATEDEGIALDKDSSRNKKSTTENEQHLFTSGLLVGIGLSFGCALIMSFVGRGGSHRR
eukprot:scaffold7_cov142-Skeletonema_menzelii.AAC.3